MIGIKSFKEHYSQALGRHIGSRDEEIRALREIEEKTGGRVKLRETEKGEKTPDRQAEQTQKLKEMASAEAAKLMREGKHILNQKVKEAIRNGVGKKASWDDDDD